MGEVRPHGAVLYFSGQAEISICRGIKAVVHQPIRCFNTHRFAEETSC